MRNTETETNVLDFKPAKGAFFDDVVQGLSQEKRSLPCKYFYDQRGSQLFDQICELDEYYLTRAELDITRRYATEMAAQIGPGVMLVEYGSGSSVKTEILLAHLEDPVAYVPVDISREHLQQSADVLANRFSSIEVLPVFADFTESFSLPEPRIEPSHDAVYFPGSTIGNFEPVAAQAMLRRIVELCGCGGGLLIGIDLQKDSAVIEAAYNDSQRVTAAFNLNLLHRIHEELDADVNVDQFEHHAIYNSDKGRVEISLVSQADQTIRIGSNTFEIAKNELIHTEYSHKYTVAGFAEMAAAEGLSLRKHWTDDHSQFAVLHFSVRD